MSNEIRIPETMQGAILPGNSTVELKEFPIPKPGHGQVIVKTKATTICGSDIRCIYREHTGRGAEGYIPGMVAGHEPAGQIVAACMEKGVLCLTAKDKVRLLPALNIPMATLQKAANIIKAVCAEE